MISRAKYEKKILSFIDKHGKVMDKNMIESIQHLWKWISEYELNMSNKIEIETRKLYVKRGANLMIKFIDSYNNLSTSLQDSLRKCRLAILRGDRAVCTEKTKKDLQSLIDEYNTFVQEMIGCSDTSSDYILSLLKRTSEILGPEYIKIKNDIELKCLTLQKEKVENL